MSRQITTVVLFVCFVFTSSALAGMWRDDFEDERNWFVAWEGLDPCWAVENGECHGEFLNVDMMEVIHTGDAKWEDYTVECKMRYEIKPSGRAGIHFRAAMNPWQGYSFQIIADTNTIKASFFQDGGEWLLDEPLHFNLSQDIWYNLKVIAKRDDFQFYIDDKPAGEFKDNRIPSGKVGFCVSNAHVHFDDLIISGDDIEDGGSWDPAKHPKEKAKVVKPKGKLTAMWGEIKSN